MRDTPHPRILARRSPEALALARARWLLPARSLVAAVLFVCLGVAAPAGHATDLDNDSIATLKWRHENPGNIVKFRLFSRLDPDDARTEIWVDVGLPGADGVYQWRFDVPEGGEIWVAVSAIDIYGLESDRSPWRHFVWQPAEARLGLPGRAHLVE